MGVQPLNAEQTAVPLLPIFAHSARLFRRALSNTVTNWRSLGQIILADPGLALQTLRLLKTDVNSQKRCHFGGMSQALMMLGTDKVNRLTLGLSVVERFLKPVSRAGFTAAASRAYHAAFQARNWAQWCNDMAAEEVFVSALLLCVPELVYWVHDADKIHLLRRTVYKEGVSCDEAEQAILGHPLQALWQNPDLEIVLPELFLDVLDPEKANQPRVEMVKLAVQLANWAEYGWYSDQVRGLVENVAQYLHKSPDQTSRIIHINAVNIGHEFPFESARPAAVLLPLIHTDDNRLLLEEFPETDSVQTAADEQKGVAKGKTGSVLQMCRSRNTRSDNLQADSQTLKERPAGSITVDPAPNPGLRQAAQASHVTATIPLSDVSECLSPNPAVFATTIKKLETGMGKLGVDEIMNIAVEGIRIGAGFHRVVFAVPSANGQYLEPRKIIGSEYDPAFKLFKVRLTKHDLFSRILEKSSSIWINDDNRGKYWQAIPQDLKVLIKTNSFCLMSIHLNGKSIGMFYVDRVSAKCPIDKQSFTLFRHLGQLAAKSLAAAANAKK